MFTHLRGQAYAYTEFREMLDRPDNMPWLVAVILIGVIIMITFPLQVIAKSRYYDDHMQYYRWVRAVNGEIPFKVSQLSPHRPIVLAIMNLVPRFIWRYMPLKWKIYHLFIEDQP